MTLQEALSKIQDPNFFVVLIYPVNPFCCLDQLRRKFFS